MCGLGVILALLVTSTVMGARPVLAASRPPALAAAQATAPPGPPLNVSASATDGGALVSWMAPAGSDDIPVATYTVTASPGGATVQVTAPQVNAIVEGLSDGTSYAFTVTAANDAGVGPASASSAAVVPLPPTVPGPAGGVTATPRDSSAVVSWTRPTSDGGRAIQTYTVVAQPGGTSVTVTAPATDAQFDGLTDGTAYRFTITATNEVGTGAASAASAPVTPGTTVPDAPEDVSAQSAGGGGVHVTWSAPTDTGGLPLQSFTVTAAPGGASVTAPGSATSATLNGLTSGTAYTFTVTANNSAGTGPASDPTQPVVPDATLTPNTTVLDSSSLATLTSYAADGTLTFTNPTAAVSMLQVGDVIAAGPSSAAPDGLLRRVTAVQVSGSTTTLSTVQAAVDDALASGDASLSSAVDPSSGGATSVAAGVSLTPSSSVSHEFDFTLSSANFDGLTVSGTLKFRPTLQFTMGRTGGLHARIVLSQPTQAQLSLSASAQVTALNVDHLIASKSMGSMVIDIGPIPFLINFAFQLYFTANGELSAGVTTTVGASFTIGSGVEYSGGQFHTVNVDPKVSHEVSPPKGFFNATLFGGPRVAVSVYVDGAVGADLSVMTGPEIRADPTANPWLEIDWRVAVTAHVGLLHLITGDFNILTKDFPIYRAPSVPSVASLMVVGDSISQGLEGDYTWRYRLSQHLEQDGVKVTFVGPWRGTHTNPTRLPDNWPTVPAAPTYDGTYRDGITFNSNHLARWGWQVHQAKDVIQDEVATYHPDTLLIELGFNDLGWGVSNADGTIADMDTLIANARNANPSLRFLVANVVHRTPLSVNPNLPALITDYDNKIGPAMQAMSTAQSPVFTVDLDSVYDANNDSYDGLHPNPTGEYAIAAQFANALSSDLNLGQPFGSIPTGVAPLTVAPPTSVTATPLDDGFLLQWSHSYGASGYWLYQRDVTLGQSFQRSALPIPADSWKLKANWLLDGHQYEFQITAARGDFESGFSPVASGTLSLKTAAPPTNFTVTPGDGTIDLGWSPPTGNYSNTVYGYAVYWFDSDDSAATLQSTQVSGPSAHLSGLVAGHLYYIAVASLNGSGEGSQTGAPSAIASAETPAAPVLTSVQVVDATTVTLTWDRSPGAAGYWIWQRDVKTGEAFHQLPLEVNGLQQVAGFLSDGTSNYQFCVQAANGTLRSPMSNCLP